MLKYNWLGRTKQSDLFFTSISALETLVKKTTVKTMKTMPVWKTNS